MELLNLSKLLRKKHFLEKKVAQLLNSGVTPDQMKLNKAHLQISDINSKIREEASRCIFGTSAIALLFETKNGFLVSSVADNEINYQLGFHGQYDYHKIKIISKLISKDDNIFIIGAHIGTLVVPLSQIANQVFAFEPNTESYNYLKLNLRLNNVINASIFNLGTYNDNTQLEFLVSRANTGGSKIKPKVDNFIYTYDNPDIVKINVIALDDFISKTGLPFPDFIIMDIEGAEYSTLIGAKNALKHSKYLYIEFVPHHLKNVADITVAQFVSSITPFFNQMQVVGYSNIFTGQAIGSILSELFRRGMNFDLLFFKAPYEIISAQT